MTLRDKMGVSLVFPVNDLQSEETFVAILDRAFVANRKLRSVTVRVDGRAQKATNGVSKTGAKHLSYLEYYPHSKPS